MFPQTAIRRPHPRERRPRILLSAVTLAAAFLLAAAVPAPAVEGVPDHPARFSACVGPALGSAGFGDMDGNFGEDAANCLAHYKIAFGTDPGVFSPSQVASRRQVALFLVRAAHSAGIRVPTASDQGFTDLTVASHVEDAINQVAALGIMEGTSSTTFDPHAPVTRREMAVLLARFLSIAPTGPGGVDIDTVIPDDDYFVDLSQVTRESRTAIRKLYELGVAAGTTAITFSPLELVSRAQVAAFISRMLAHTNARPAGLNVQVAAGGVDDSDTTLLVSYRNTDREPLADKLVDVFMSTDPDKAFDESGSCTGHAASVGGRRACVLDSADSMTGSTGNVLVDLEVGDVYALRVWAWMGGLGDVYDEDSGQATVIDVMTPREAKAVEVSDDMQLGARKLRFGATVTFTFLIVDEDGNPVRKAGVEVTVAAEESRNGRTRGPATNTVVTGADGSAEIAFRHADPSDEPGDVAQLALDILSSADLEVRDRTTIGMLSSDDLLLDWADEESEPTSIRLSVPTEYEVASSAGTGVGGTVRARLTDQYGSGVAGEVITFMSDDSFVFPKGVDRTTNLGGLATLYYKRDSDSGGIELITGRFGNMVDNADRYWAAPIPGGTGGSGEVRVVDADNNRAVVVAGTDVWLVEYRGTDHFKMGEEWIALTAFEDNLTVGDTLAFEIASAASAVDTFTLTNG